MHRASGVHRLPRLPPIPSASTRRPHRPRLVVAHFLSHRRLPTHRRAPPGAAASFPLRHRRRGLSSEARRRRSNRPRRKQSRPSEPRSSTRCPHPSVGRQKAVVATACSSVRGPRRYAHRVHRHAYALRSAACALDSPICAGRGSVAPAPTSCAPSGANPGQSAAPSHPGIHRGRIYAAARQP